MAFWEYLSLWEENQNHSLNSKNILVYYYNPQIRN